MSHYAESMMIYQEETFPIGFAKTQHAMAIAHRQLAMYVDKPTHLKHTVKCYENALRVYTETCFPRLYEMVSANCEKSLKDVRAMDGL